MTACIRARPYGVPYSYVTKFTLGSIGIVENEYLTSLVSLRSGQWNG